MEFLKLLWLAVRTQSPAPSTRHHALKDISWGTTVRQTPIKRIFQIIILHFSRHYSASFGERGKKQELSTRKSERTAAAVPYGDALILSFWLLGLAPSSLGLQELNFPGMGLPITCWWPSQPGEFTPFQHQLISRKDRSSAQKPRSLCVHWTLKKTSHRTV